MEAEGIEIQIVLRAKGSARNPGVVHSTDFIVVERIFNFLSNFHETQVKDWPPMRSELACTDAILSLTGDEDCARDSEPLERRVNLER